MGCMQSAESVDELSVVKGTGFDEEPEAASVASTLATTVAEEKREEGRREGGDVLDSFFESNPFFVDVKSKGKEAAKKHLVQRRFAKGDVVLEELAMSNSMFIVVDGAVDLLRSGKSTGRVLLANGTVGEASFFFKTRSTAAAVAAKDTVVLELTRKVFDAHRRAAWLKPLTNFVVLSSRQLVCAQLRNVDMFADMAEDKLRAVSNLFTMQVVPPSTRIFKEGDPGDAYFILGTGRLTVTLSKGGSTSGLDIVELKTLEAGAAFGDISLLERTPRTATVAALQASTLFKLSASSFDEFLAKAPELHRAMVARIQERAAMNQLTREIPFVKSLGPNKLHLLAEVSMAMSYQPEAVILRQGQRHPNMFFILADGGVEVLINKTKIKDIDQRGSYFGEISIVSNSAHSATVRAGPKGARCLACTKSEFKSIFQGENAMFAEVSIKVLGKDSELKHVLNHPLARTAFLKHCEREFAVENIDFVVATEALERMGAQQVRREVLEALGHNVDEVIATREKELKARSLDIYNRFVDPGAPQAINIDAKVREEIQQRIEREEWSYAAFTAAKFEVYDLLERDNFSRFQKSKGFEEVLTGLGVYDDGKRASMKKNMMHLSKRTLDARSSVPVQARVQDQILD